MRKMMHPKFPRVAPRRQGHAELGVGGRGDLVVWKIMVETPVPSYQLAFQDSKIRAPRGSRAPPDDTPPHNGEVGEAARLTALIP